MHFGNMGIFCHLACCQKATFDRTSRTSAEEPASSVPPDWMGATWAKRSSVIFTQPIFGEV
jgi:hypothetical protein